MKPIRILRESTLAQSGKISKSAWNTSRGGSELAWIKYTVRFFSFLLPGATRLFSRSEAAQAREWIVAELN
jgi:hypothetical protein